MNSALALYKSPVKEPKKEDQKYKTPPKSKRQILRNLKVRDFDAKIECERKEKENNKENGNYTAE